jgi:hypothetical protein
MVTMLKSLPMPSVSGPPLEEILEGARRATGESSPIAARPDLEVAAVGRRRRFTHARAKRGPKVCAEHVRQLGGESPLPTKGRATGKTNLDLPQRASLRLY